MYYITSLYDLTGLMGPKPNTTQLAGKLGLVDQYLTHKLDMSG